MCEAVFLVKGQELKVGHGGDEGVGYLSWGIVSSEKGDNHKSELTRVTNSTNDPGSGVNEGYRHPINQFHNKVTATYWRLRPSFFSKGYILLKKSIRTPTSLGQIETDLNVATLLTRTPQCHTLVSGVDPESSNVSGRRGRRIDFSWTWKEKRKKDIDEVKSAYGRRGREGQGSRVGGGLATFTVD